VLRQRESLGRLDKAGVLVYAPPVQGFREAREIVLLESRHSTSQTESEIAGAAMS
jgi:hypothetical protein